MKKPYETFSSDKLILRDHLAIDRTVLANERTVLSYVRTSLAIAAIGGTILHFVKTPLAFVFGLVFLGLGFGVLLVGVVRYKKVREEILDLRKKGV